MGRIISEDLRWRVRNKSIFATSRREKNFYKKEEYQAEQLIFLDETSKDERSLSRTYGYSFKNQRISQKIVFLRGVRYTILPAFTLDGFIACEIMKGRCPKERFCSFVLSQISPFINPCPGKNSVLVMAFSTVKSWIKRNKDFMETCPDPEFSIIAAFS
ncbi:homeodomain-like protein [Rhizophagus irregularis DAOM 181602=DAOM 197198]|nr:homeodomain-like protein [Rhizophagus irregularis DAOM 181602=DAOM 197198]